MLLFDENISPVLVDFLAKCGAPTKLQHLRKLGWSGKPDADWIPRAIENGWVIVTADRNDATRGFAVAQLKALGVRMVWLGPFWDHLGRWEKAKWLVNHVEPIADATMLAEASTVLLFNQIGPPRSI
ncbi:MAG: DUF5615 family PIN-like protein [Fimbriimonadaceae bacterium]|nr:DUF5615 family PIN-like protein [Fimbriimonadaceae bacterium]